MDRSGEERLQSNRSRLKNQIFSLASNAAAFLMRLVVQRRVSLVSFYLRFFGTKSSAKVKILRIRHKMMIQLKLITNDANLGD
mmetsp:Transcript_24830/g.50845  ORF Transcript_24830/g.50845 Transcript_24830/m.50845 type:complete len:83 (-) Transcript_24830:29-277(-)